MDDVENLIEEYISPEQAMFRYGKEKKIELIYEKNKDKEETKIRNEILKKLVDFIENDPQKNVEETNEKTEKHEENDCTFSAITTSVECKNDMTCSEKKGLIDQNKKNRKLIDIIMYLKKYNFCNENIKRGTSVNLISQLFEEIDFIELEIEYFRAIINFFIKKIEDWHCINGVLNFFLIIFERYKNKLEEMQYCDEITEEYKKLFISKNKKEKNNMNNNDNIYDKNKIIGSENDEINENVISNYYNNYNSENESNESWRSSYECQHEKYNRRDNDFEEFENEEESENEKIKENRDRKSVV